MLFSRNDETPLVRMFRTEYSADYKRMKKTGYEITDENVRLILGFPAEKKKKFLGLF